MQYAKKKDAEFHENNTSPTVKQRAGSIVLWVLCCSQQHMENLTARGEK